MTEERIKELALAVLVKIAAILAASDSEDIEGATAEIENLIRTVAAEAREEGRETLQKLYDNLKGAYWEEQQWAIKLKIELAEKTAQMLQAEKAIKLALGKCPFPVGAMKAKEALESVCAERLKEGG